MNPYAGEPPHRSALRKGRRSIPGQAYFLTKCIGARGAKDLMRPACADIVVNSFIETQGMGWWRLLGFAVMPDHYHLIVGLGNVKSLSDAVAGVSKFTARRVNPLLGRDGAFWEEGFYDHMIRMRSDFDRILAYVHNNPVVAGLCSRPEDWPYSTAHRQFAHLIDRDWIGVSVPTGGGPRAPWDSGEVPAEYR